MKKLAKILGVLVLLAVLLVGAFVAWANATYEKRLQFADTATPNIKVEATPELIEEGRYLVRGPAHCASCHSLTDRAHPELIAPDSPLTGGLEFAMGPIETTWAANLTPDTETGIGAMSDGELARVIRTGVMRTGELSFLMKLSVAELSDHDVAAVIAYLRSLAPVKNAVKHAQWGPVGKLMLPMLNLAPDPVEGPAHVAASAEPSIERGGYLAKHAAYCVSCHSAFDMQTLALTGPQFAGGTPEPSHGDADKEMEYAAPNLTSDATGVTGKLTEDEFVARMKGGRAYSSSIMPWENYREMTETDVRSIYRFLKSVPPVAHDTGPSYRPIKK